MKSLPVIPESAPFTPEQRQWLNGYIAGLFSEADGAPAVVSKPKVRVPVLYASQSGNSEGLAEGFAEELSTAGFDAPCISTEDYQEIDLTKEKQLLLVSSTWGEGDPPDNATGYYEAFMGDGMPQLSNLKYSVCALGDTSYEHFCNIGIDFDERLS